LDFPFSPLDQNPRIPGAVSRFLTTWLNGGLLCLRVFLMDFHQAIKGITQMTSQETRPRSFAWREAGAGAENSWVWRESGDSFVVASGGAPQWRFGWKNLPRDDAYDPT